jgi:mycothiol synthase
VAARVAQVGTTRADLIRTEHLSRAEVADVLRLTRAAGDADGAYPLSEHVTLHLRHGGDAPAVHLLARTGEHGLVGYAHIDTTDLVAGASAELCVHPLHRRHGLGRALVMGAMEAARERDPTGRLRLWAHGDHPSANALALSLGFIRSRVLWQMRRSLFAPVPAPVLPDRIHLRQFRPGVDDVAWLRLNARAFADHPDQGRWSEADLQVRLAERWFDPAGFLLAERDPDGALVGFHWTKVHGTVRAAGQAATEPPATGQAADEPPADEPPATVAPAAEPPATEAPATEPPATGAEHDHDPIGEVYILGVDPDASGHGLGRALTLAGLRHLRERGLDQVMLYVEEPNSAAVGLYQGLGFARWSTDVCFARPVDRA